MDPTFISEADKQALRNLAERVKISGYKLTDADRELMTQASSVANARNAVSEGRAPCFSFQELARHAIFRPE